MTHREPPTKVYAENVGEFKCSCARQSCIDKFTIGETKQLRLDVENRSPSEKVQWLVEQLRTMGVAREHKHMDYRVLGRPVCRHGFLNVYGLTVYALNQARNHIQQGHSALRLHGNALPGVQAERGTMMSAIRGIIYADCIQVDEEKIQTGATFVNITKGSLIKLSHQKITKMWLDDELPQGDSRCRDSPPTYAMVKEAIDGLRNEFGTDIHFAKDTGKWFICTICFEREGL